MEHADVQEIETLADLLKLQQESGHSVIIDAAWIWHERFADCALSVEIYDGYRE